VKSDINFNYISEKCACLSEMSVNFYRPHAATFQATVLLLSGGIYKKGDETDCSNYGKT
jgi:hypothetical protein